MRCCERVHLCQFFFSLEHRSRSDRTHMAFQLNRANDNQTMELMEKIAIKVEKRIIITEHIQTFDSLRSLEDNVVKFATKKTQLKGLLSAAILVSGNYHFMRIVHSSIAIVFCGESQ